MKAIGSHNSIQRLASVSFAAAMLVGVLAATLIAGCEQRVVRSTWDGIPWDEKPTNTDRTAGGRQRTSSGLPTEKVWSIPLERFDGGARYNKARLLLRRVNEQTRLSDVWIEDFGEETLVYAGRFHSPQSHHAQSLLAQIRQIEIDGVKPFKHAFIEPLVHKDQRTGNPLDLRQYSGYYTLQVAFFDEAYPDDREQAAKQYAQELRNQGHQAYYYHGPHRSHVTIGLFDYEQAFSRRDDPLSNEARVDAYSQQILNLQETFPYNVGNGYTIVEKRDGQSVGEQPSCLVKVN